MADLIDASEEDLTDAGPHREQEQPGQDLDEGNRESSDSEDVRPAGPAQMDMPPKEWRKEDEESDESFPASDPPGNY